MTDTTIAPLRQALDDTGALVAAVGDEQWGLPTPCTDWTVRQLTNHLVAGNLLFAEILRGTPLPPMDELRRRSGEDRLGADPAAAYRAAAGELLAAFGEPGVLDRTYTVPAGTMPGPAALHLRIVELLAHGWDLARATGQQPPYPEELAERELAFSRERLGALPPDRSPFAPPQPVADDAPALDRLAALLGRPVEGQSGGRSS